MKQTNGNIWDMHEQGFTVCVTTNNTLTRNKEIVMGGGCALEAKERFPRLPKELARILTEDFTLPYTTNRPVYFKEYNIITFPTKNAVYNKSNLSLIAQSCVGLMDIIKQNELSNVYLPRPGVGLGGLDWNKVKNTISTLLSDEVIVITNE